jgi:hypothetical protein
MELEPEEIELLGVWEWRDGRIQGDATEKRISWLLTHALQRISFTADGYEMCFRDPRDGRYWELTFPQPQGFGVGPQKLCVISKDHAVEKYKIAP